MAQLLLIKNANTPSKTIGDIIGFYEDSHIFSSSEHEAFEILKVEGFTRAELFDYAFQKTPERERIFKSKTTEWTLVRPEGVDAWNDDGTWRFMKESYKYEYTIRNMTPEEKAILSDPKSLDKLLVLEKLEITFGMNVANTEEVPNIVKEVSVIVR